MKIGVYGSSAGELMEENLKKAAALGEAIAKAGHSVVTGACNGLPAAAQSAAFEAGGETIGFSPTASASEHKAYGGPTEGFTKVVYIPGDYEHKTNLTTCQKYRNVSSVAAVDAAIIIGGRIGSMNEFTIAHDLGKVIGVLEGSGGISERAIAILLEDAKKEKGATVIFESDPATLVAQVIAATEN